MSTFMANKANIERKWYILDAAGKPLGKTAVRAADLLRGKGKVTFTPHADCGDNVIIINAGKAVLTGKKSSLARAPWSIGFPFKNRTRGFRRLQEILKENKRKTCAKSFFC